jgi:glycosyltransferase involved in cell wall biosynthesis
MENNVEFRGFVTHDTAIEALRQAHISLILLPETGEGRVMFTNKFFECLAARRPILAVVPDGVISEVVSENEIGEVVPPNDAPAISRAMLKMFDTLRARPNAYRMPDGLLARFERRELTRQLASALDDVAGNREQEPGAIVGQA